MKRKTLIILSTLVILSFVGGSAVSGFTVNSVDGVWGKINGVTTTSNYYPVDGIGYAREGVLAPERANQGYRLINTVCSPMQNITPPWPNLTRWTSTGVDWTGFGSHSSTCTTAPSLMFSQFVYSLATTGGSCNSASSTDTDCDLLAIEIVNLTSSTVDLNDYDLLLFTDERSSTRIGLSGGNLASGGVYVVRNYRASGSVSGNETISNNNNYRTIVLVKNTGTDTEGARNDRWATGPANSPTIYSDFDPNIQNLSTTDENQVRYGRDAFSPANGWNSYSAEVTDFAQQSGFGFDGRNDPITPAALTPFFLGKFVHYNNQIFTSDDNYENAIPFVSVDLTVTVPVTCNDGSTPNPSSFTIKPHFVLDETSNSAGTCIYPGTSICPDKVTVEMPAANPTFVCPDGTYTVNILGFTTKGLGTETCDVSYDANSVSAAFITQEDQNNQACLWARIEQPLADISAAKTCQQWDTTGRYYEITASNLGPGFARTVTLTDTLPAGVTWKSYTSQLITASGTITQGTCSHTGQVVDCSLGTPLLDYSTDPAAKWVVRIYVNLTGTTVLNTATVSSITTDPFPANNSSTASCEVTGVTLISFDAENKPEGVLLSWETASEVDNLGFNLYKADGPEAEKVKINPAMIPSKAMGGTSGAFYEYLVENVEPGQPTFYWLEAIDFDLTTVLYGPISVK